MRDPAEELKEIRGSDLYRTLRPLRRLGPVEVEEEGRRLVQFASNDYLGLAHAEVLGEAMREAVARYGAGAGASRLITGSHGPHGDLEEELADFKRTERALSFGSGYAVALGTIPALMQKGDFVILDKLCHACLIDAVRLSGATLRVFPHNDLNKLADHLDWARRKATPRSRILVVTESVFSMDGDRADLAAMVQLKEEAGALLMVDEAHAVGVLGAEGRGLAEELGVVSEVDFQMGTLSKALGVAGGYLAASGSWIDLLVQKARSFIFSTAPPPALAATANRALSLVRGEEGETRREQLRENQRCLKEALGHTEELASPICPWMVGEAQAALTLSERLREEGYWVPAIRFPTVPRGTARLRLSLSSAHERGQIEGVAGFLRASGEDEEGER